MIGKSKKRRATSHPKDRSLEAYKEWFMQIVKRLTKEGTEIRLTEEEWIASWKEYWKENSNG
jgi:hypothetical protein